MEPTVHSTIRAQSVRVSMMAPASAPRLSIGVSAPMVTMASIASCTTRARRSRRQSCVITVGLVATLLRAISPAPVHKGNYKILTI